MTSIRITPLRAAVAALALGMAIAPGLAEASVGTTASSSLAAFSNKPASSADLVNLRAEVSPGNPVPVIYNGSANTKSLIVTDVEFTGAIGHLTNGSGIPRDLYVRDCADVNSRIAAVKETNEATVQLNFQSGILIAPGKSLCIDSGSSGNLTVALQGYLATG